MAAWFAWMLPSTVAVAGDLLFGASLGLRVLADQGADPGRRRRDALDAVGGLGALVHRRID